MTDEQQIRSAIDTWLEASKEGDGQTLASLLDDDMLFVVAAGEPFGKKEFFAGGTMKPSLFESKADVREVVVHGDWAMTRLVLDLKIVPPGMTEAMTLKGPILSLWRKGADGRWRLWRDANMVAPVAPAQG
jgi:uncharacterized protein (TIGR02246 family)